MPATYVLEDTNNAVNTQTVGNQIIPVVTGLAGGGYVLTWVTSDTTQDGSGYAIKAQIFGANDQPVGGEFLVNTLATGDQSAPAITALNDGGFVIAWESGTGPTSIRAQAFSATGVKSGAEIVVNASVSYPAYAPTITTLTNGNYVIAWESSLSPVFTSGPEIRAQIFSPSGVRIGSEFYVNTTITGVQAAPAIAELTGGGFVVTWQLGNQPSNDIYAQVFDANGNKVGSEFRVNTNTAGVQVDPQIVGLSNGGFAITWTTADTTADGSGQAIKAQIYTATGVPVGTEFLVNTTAADSQASPTITTLADGNFIIAWGLQANVNSTSATRAQIFDVTGSRVGSEFILVNDPNSSEMSTSIAALADGGFVFGFSRFTTTTIEVGAVVFAPNPAPVIVSNGGGTTADVTIAEGTQLVTTIAATDAGGSVTISYSIVGGVDAARFTIDPTTGALSFASAPNYETPTDVGGDNVYNVVVRASDGLDGDTQAIAVTVANVNETPTITSAGAGPVASMVVFENVATVATVVAADPDGTAPIYSIVGGADAAQFVIDAVTGALSFVASPDYESPVDANGDNVYEVVVQASDDSLSDTQTISITLNNVNEAPVITSDGAGTSAALGIAENSAAVTTVTSTDPDGNPRTYSISGGADAALFTIDSATGVLSFVSAPNYEAPTDSDGNNVYQVTVSASDGSLVDTQTLAVTVSNVNEAPAIVSTANISASENSVAAGIVAATDPDGTALTYSIVGGTDAALFTVDVATGALSFVNAPNFETPGDADGDNAFQVTVQASDGSYFAAQAVTVTVGNVNEAPVILYDDTSGPITIGVNEGTTAVHQLVAYDPDGAALSYSITGGADAAFFTIDALTGALSFIAGQDREAPADADGDNVYNVVVIVSDGTISATETIGALIMNVNETPTITLPASFAVNEGTSFVTFNADGGDPDGGLLTYSLSGADAALFTINPFTGVVMLVANLDHEAPLDADDDNVYELTVTVSDGELSAAQGISITVSDVNESPAITSGGSFAIAENTAAVATLAGSDPEGTALTWSISGGADAALFTINAQTGAVSFIAAPNFEAPGDSDQDNVYNLVITASDGSISTSGSYTVTVGNVNEAPVITGSTVLAASENGTAVATLSSTDPEGNLRTWSISGGADAARFVIDAQTGALSFITAPDYEAPTDNNGDNQYLVQVTVSDGSLSSSQLFTINLGNVNEAPLITSNGGGSSASLTLAENTATVTTVTSTDPEGTARTYSIVGGADAARFTVNASTGALTFITAPNYEAPADSNLDNIYNVIVAASDGLLTDTQALAITVTNVNEAPVITSNGGGDTAAITVNENTTAVTTLTSTDPEGTARTYSIVGGADAARFTINASTGALSFVSAPNWEAPTDSNGDNVYNVIVAASDGTLTDTQTLAVTVGNVVDGSTINGTNSANTLTGTTAEDTINGLGGNDTITGGLGADVLTGGTGADTFVYSALNHSTLSAPDRITDFTLSQNDRISLSGIDANTGLAGDQAFSWIGTGNFTNVAGQLRYYQQNGHTYVTGDVNGDGVGDFLIQLDPAVTLSASYFVL